MTAVTIKVAGTEGPKAGKVRGRIKDESGIIYQISPALLNMVRIGSTYDITYKDEEFNGSNGLVKFRVVESLAPSVGGSAAPSAPRQAAAPSYAPQGSMANDDKDESIATLAIIKCQQLPVGDRAGIFHALKASALAWRDFKKWQKSASSDMNGDEVPFDR